MYNRYIPHHDGTFHRHQIQEQIPQQRQAPAAQKPEPAVAPPHPAAKTPESHAGFSLRNLLPKEFDTGDLIVVLLLLLMAGDCQEDQNTALLTLALYFFM